jgi:hypothetical protein
MASLMKDQFLIYCLKSIIVASMISGGCTGRSEKNKEVVFGDSIYLKNIPSQPGEESWKFIKDLKSPLWTHHNWVKSPPGVLQADLSAGVKLITGFPDPEGRLETAYDDFYSFLKAGDVSYENGRYLIEIIEDKKLSGEAFRLLIEPGKCRISAGDAEGVRRGIFWLEDEMLRNRGPLLTTGKVEKQPVIKRRISRCFFGPIKRPPKMRDELMDDVNYYPDQYLNRLAHEGVNGLWLTVEFRDLVSTTFTPEAGENGPKRLAKLRQTVASCLRYGIRTYIFCIEPRAWDADSPVLKHFPVLGGAGAGENQNYFCPSSKTAGQYLYETVNTIFKAVPELGGMINISLGERATICLTEDGKIKCPRCSDKKPWEVLNASLSAMEKGMHDAAPDAELISWLYMPQPQRFETGDNYDLADWVYEIAAHTPKGVILQFNFESGVTRTEFGKLLVGGDYWISNPGPSPRFSRIAEIARKNGTDVSAKIQSGNSHEVASIPYVTVPSLLYRKFDAMRKLGVSHTMLCWYFGSYPGLMNKAAGLLSMNPFPQNEDAFLQLLASLYWKEKDVSKVVEAWKYFSEGYENYPLINLFQYYGPMADGPVWPLLLKPADAPLSPTWQTGSGSTLKSWPPSGDRIGECTGNVLTLEETVELTRRMTISWEKGMAILTGLENKYADEPERLLEIGVAKALGIQLRSGYNILNFYFLREKMLHIDGRERLSILDQLCNIISDELEMDKQLLLLCEKDSRLGYHSEAEGYKYFPEKIKWRMEQLKNVLINDVPDIKKIILKDQPLFPEYTGRKPVGPVAECCTSDGSIWSDTSFVLPLNLKWQPFGYGSDSTNLQWASVYCRDDLYIVLSEKKSSDHPSGISPFAGIDIKIEPQRLYPAYHFLYDSGNTDNDSDPERILGYPLVYKTGLRQINEKGTWFATIRIPFKTIGLNTALPHPVRMDVTVQLKDGGFNSWRPNNPLTERLILGSDNPADLGWLVFRDKP